MSARNGTHVVTETSGRIEMSVRAIDWPLDEVIRDDGGFAGADDAKLIDATHVAAGGDRLGIPVDWWLRACRAGRRTRVGLIRPSPPKFVKENPCAFGEPPHTFGKFLRTPRPDGGFSGRLGPGGGDFQRGGVPVLDAITPIGSRPSELPRGRRRRTRPRRGRRS